MKISTQAIKFINEHYGSAGDPAPEGVDALVEKIGAQLGAVEEVVDFGERFEGVIVVKVVVCEKHPNADRLHVCKVDDGGKAQNVERDENGHVQVVCGAPNVQAGMLAAWLPPGTTVPSTIGKDPFVLEARELRGVVSNGMLASPKELTLGDKHEGILDIDGEIDPGTMFADAFHLRGDAVIDIENKMFTHRPDCFGWLGAAREIAGIQGQKFTSPEWYKANPEFPGMEAEELKLEVSNELPGLTPRFTAVAMSGVEVKPSPVWLQVDLARLGLRPVNNIVDYTNYFMLMTGQPLHAYDYDKILALQESSARSNEQGARLGVRHPRPGEKLKLLNDKEIEPRSEAILITAGDVPIGLGGVMGGADTEVDENTKNIIIECANFDMYSIRRTSMAHGLFTDAVTRFNKGQSPLQNLAALAKITNEIRQYAGGKVASPLIDDNHLPEEVMQRGNLHPPVTITARFVNERLGWNLSAEEMKTLLENVEFKVHITDDGQLTVTAPFWRTDIEIPEDIVEEIGRLYGYDKLPLDLPRRDLTPPARNPLLEFKNQTRQLLSRAGANETLTYSFVHGGLLDKTGQDRGMAFKIANALSPDLQYFRLSLMPSLLDKVHANIKSGHNEFAMFELGKIHSKTVLDDDGLPVEFSRIAMVFAADDKTAARKYSGAAYYQARKYLDILLEHFGAADSVEWRPLADADFGGHALIEQMAKPFEPNRSAVLVKNGLVVGVAGEYRQAVQKALKLPAFCAGFESFHSYLIVAGQGGSYTQLPRFPKVEQDICLKVAADLTYGELYNFAEDQLGQNRPDQTHHTLTPVDIYQREDDKEHKQITLRLQIASFERTLTDQEVNDLLDKVAQAANEKFNAERI